jgi:hypothetical protein
MPVEADGLGTLQARSSSATVGTVGALAVAVPPDRPNSAYVYERHDGGRSIVVALNLPGADQPLDRPCDLLLSTHLGEPPAGVPRAHEGRIILPA